LATLINAGLFQLTWFGCVVGGAAGEPWWGAPALIGLFVYAAIRKSFWADMSLLAVLLPIGWLLEVVWIDNGILIYGQDGVPIWILMLWAGVALTVNHSLAWFQRYPFCGAALAAVAAPLCYLGGERLDAVLVPEPLQLVWVSLAWLIVFYAMFTLASRALDWAGRLIAVRQ
jgi:hypothetical protein